MSNRQAMIDEQNRQMEKLKFEVIDRVRRVSRFVDKPFAFENDGMHQLEDLASAIFDITTKRAQVLRFKRLDEYEEAERYAEWERQRNLVPTSPSVIQG